MEMNTGKNTEKTDRQAGVTVRQRRRRKRKKVNGLKLLKRLGILLGILALLILIFIFAFRIKNVNVQGNTRYTKEEILDILAFDEQPDNTILFYLKNRRFTADNIPFIDAVYIDIGSRDTINIQIVEKMIIGCIENNGQYVYFDTDGMICEISERYESDVPKIEGLTFENLDINTVLTVEDSGVYDSLLTLTLLLQKYELSVDRVVFEENHSMNMQMGNIRVLLGNGANLEDKISEFKNLLPQLENLKGTLHLENYDSTKDSIIFSKEY